MKESKVSPGRRSPGGRSFHSRGPAAEKLLSPSLLCVRGTSSFRMSLELFAMGDDQRPTEGDSHLRGTREPVHQATDVRAPQSWTQHADGLAASAAAVTLVWCGHSDGRLWPGGRQRSAPTAGVKVVRRWCRTAVSCNSPGDTRWTPGRASWWHWEYRKLICKLRRPYELRLCMWIMPKKNRASFIRCFVN